MKLVRFASGGRKGVGVVTGDGVVEVGAALRSEGNVDVGEGADVTPLLALGDASIELLRATVESGGAATLSRDAVRLLAPVEPPSVICTPHQVQPPALYCT